MEYRTEQDFLGQVRIRKDCLWGIHTQRSLDNFKVSSLRLSPRLIKAMAFVKKACCLANLETGYLNDDKAGAILNACDEMLEGKHLEQFLVDPLQGGAGTSTNMNINEVIANRAIEILGHERGHYLVISPIRDVNMHQSTNDVYPTAVKVAVIRGIRELSGCIEILQSSFQEKEKEFADIVKLGRTEMQEAVPMTLGAEFSAFSETIARDRWRVFKCEERLRQVNIGGTAIGTGLTAPRRYIFLVIEKLRELTGLGLARGENVVDQTSNSDVFVEVAGILNAHAANLIKICNDLRLLNMLKEIKVAPVQTGSSIMPGKVNPVILESAVQACLKVNADCGTVFDAACRGSLQINEFMPLLSHSILEAVDILIKVNSMLAKNVRAITAEKEVCMRYVENSPFVITAFVPLLGYEKCENILREFLANKDKYPGIKDFLKEKIGEETVEKVLSPAGLMSLGYRDNEKGA